MKLSMRILMALFLALCLTMTAGAEEAEVTSEPVETPPEAVEVALDDLALDNAMYAVPVYETKDRNVLLMETGHIEFYIGDHTSLYLPEGRIASYKLSKPGIVSIVKFIPSLIEVSASAPGKTRLTVRLEDDRQVALNIQVRDPYLPTAIALDGKRFDLRVGQDMQALDHVILSPEWATTQYQFKSSSRKVASVDADGLVTAKKAGKATITVKTGNRLSAKFTVNVRANCADALAPKPKKADTAALGDGWTLWPQSLIMNADGSAVLEACVLNGSKAALNAIENLNLALSLVSDSGEAPLARHAFGKINVSCGKGKTRAVKLTFPRESVQWPNADLATGKVSARLCSSPKGASRKAALTYVSNDYMPSGTEPDNPTVYRALLVSEDQFYWRYEPGDDSAWEYDGRNRGDVRVMKEMLESVKTPDGGQYAVTTRHNTDRQQFMDLIADTFADADENDVSLFFFASHGIDDEGFPDEEQGALGMASVTEQYPELLLISELRDCLLKVPGRVIVMLNTCGSGAAIYQSNSATDLEAAERACAAFDAAVVKAFREADPGIADGEVQANTGELRIMNKFYVLTASAYQEASYGLDDPTLDLNNHFTAWLSQGVGHSGSMPADQRYAGNRDGMVDLHELFRYIASVGNHYYITIDGILSCQHVQVYPADTRYPLFK